MCNSDYDTDVDVFCAQELKDEPRDVDTETEEELLLLVLPGDVSNGSRFESCSPSDRSSSADGCEVQIFVGDEPFAGKL